MSKIAEIARKRTTQKVLANPSDPLPAGGITRGRVEAMIDAAGWAPFHVPGTGGQDGGPIEPWRMHMLDSQGCRDLILRVQTLPMPPKKIADMLAAADALILVTWLPEEGAYLQWEPSLKNMEHIAAAGAAIQTLLLAATELGIANYWSSGGSLATPEAFELLDIPSDERLLGAIFLFPESAGDAEISTGKLRSKRSAAMHWSRWVDLPQ